MLPVSAKSQSFPSEQSRNNRVFVLARQASDELRRASNGVIRLEEETDYATTE